MDNSRARNRGACIGNRDVNEACVCGWDLMLRTAEFALSMTLVCLAVSPRSILPPPGYAPQCGGAAGGRAAAGAAAGSPRRGTQVGWGPVAARGS